jgi:hypothetical protein
MRPITTLLLTLSLSAGACAELVDDPRGAPRLDPAAQPADRLAAAIDAGRLRPYREIRPAIVAAYGEAAAVAIDRQVASDEPVGAVPPEFLPVVLPSGMIEVSPDTFDRYVAGELSPERDIAGWAEAGLLSTGDRDQLDRYADALGLPRPTPPASDLARAPGDPVACGDGWNCKVVLSLMVTKRETSSKDETRNSFCGQYAGETTRAKWGGSVADFFANGGTIWRYNLFASDSCLADTDSHETGKREVTGTVVMTTEALDATKPKSCPGDLSAGVNLWGEAHQTAELRCVAKHSGTWGFSVSSETPWDCYAVGGVGCSVSGVGEQQLISTVEHKPDCQEKDSTSVNAKWSADKGWEVSGGAASETSCKKNLDSESRAAMDCQIVRGPDIAWRSDANPRPTVQATIGGKTFRAKAKSLGSYRVSVWAFAKKITAEGAAKTTANSAKVSIAATCSTNHPNDPTVACEVRGGRSDGY